MFKLLHHKTLKHIGNIVQFQKISIPTPWKVNGNSKGVGVLKAKNLKGMYWA